MEEDDDESKDDPEDRVESTNPGPSSMQLQDVLFMSRRLRGLLDVDDVLEVVHVLVVRSDIQDGGHRLRQLNRELLHDGAQLYWRVKAPAG